MGWGPAAGAGATVGVAWTVAAGVRGDMRAVGGKGVGGRAGGVVVMPVQRFVVVGGGWRG